ncbi:MAG: hypothetical protein LBM77_00005, partial [Spirochaetaceae bacterium]|nr:hypothetical protein [Spirochaetaceae bacterium]
MIYRRYIGTKRLALVLVVLLLLTACQPLLRLPTAIETEPELPPLAQPDAGAGTEEPVYLAEPDAIGNIAGDYLTFTIESIPKLNSSPSGGG